jgi:bifunctional enzyme CysN/CysC
MSNRSALIEEDIERYLREHEQKDMLRFITCGSVDDGKSTLIGRLLHDTHKVFEDQLTALKSDSRKHGTTGDELDMALLVDGLQSEREQGITIDVAYRYFTTEKRKFILADTPGHEQYTRNMATGASTADLAIILIDARKGVLTQTRRHSYICSLLGIRHALVAINKMDLVNFEQATFEKICDDYRQFSRQMDFSDLRFIPISALRGDNVAATGEGMPWYEGPTLLEILETIDVTGTRNAMQDLRFPVQYVNRPDDNFRGFAGNVISGSVSCGDHVMALPSRKTSVVKDIVAYDGNLQQASAGMAATLTFADEIDISRGDIIVHSDRAPHVGNSFDATVIWMHESPLLTGKQYEFKLGTKTTRGMVQHIHHQTDVNTLAQTSASELRLNQIGSCRVVLADPVAFDAYETCRGTGAFIVIDRLSNATVGAGMIAGAVHKISGADNENVVWHTHKVTRTMHANQKGQKPCVIWFTGLSGSGKSSIANALEQMLYTSGYHTYLLDGDNVRRGLNRDLDFSDTGRVENIRRIGEAARLFVDAGLIVLTAFISPFRSDRTLVRDLLGNEEFVEVFVDTPLEVCEQRDIKGLYRKARDGKIKNFTGIDSPYEPPAHAELVLQTVRKTPEDCAVSVYDYLVAHDILKN